MHIPPEQRFQGVSWLAVFLPSSFLLRGYLIPLKILAE
jgi:hypothetical protein